MTTWPLLVATLLTCGGFGTLFFAGVSQVRGFGARSRIPALAAALVLLVAGFAVIAARFGTVGAVMATLRGVTRLSGVSLAMLFIVCGIIVALVHLVAQAREASPGALVAIAAVGMLVGLLGAWFAGAQFALPNKTNWNTPALAASYLLNAVAMGGTLFCSLMALLERDERDALRGPLVGTAVAIALELVALVAWAAHTGFSVDAAVFWGGAVAVGCALALACVLAALRVPQVVIVAFLCSAAGGMCLRAAMKLADSDFITSIQIAASGVHGWGA